MKPGDAWRVYTPCPEVHPDDGRQCERELGHPPQHWYSVWERDETGENYPSYPVMWGDP